MLKRTLYTMTALSSLILIIPTLQNAAIAGQFNKPMIRMIAPQVKMRINTRRLVTKAAKKPAGNKILEAGPQPEPPTRPKRTKVTNVAKEDLARLPRPRPYNEFEEDGNGGKIDVADALPPALGGAPELEELFGVTGGNMNDIRDAASLLENGLDGQNALPEHLRGNNENISGDIGGERPFGANREGVWDPRGGRGSAFGPGGSNDGFGVDMMAGIPRSPASQAPNPGGQASNGWSFDGMQVSGSGTYQSWRTTDSNGDTVTFVREDFNDGAGSVSITITDADGNVRGDVSIDISKPHGRGRDYQAEAHDADGNLVGASKGTTETESVPNRYDPDGDGVPNDVPETGSEQAGQPNPEDGGAAEGLCAGWNPLSGCGQGGLKIWDTITQPGTSEESTATASGAGPRIGPEAVTNGGDGSFTAGGGRRDNGRGHGIDPCITAGGCGNGPDGPDNPTGSMEGVRASLN